MALPREGLQFPWIPRDTTGRRDRRDRDEVAGRQAGKASRAEGAGFRLRLKELPLWRKDRSVGGERDSPSWAGREGLKIRAGVPTTVHRGASTLPIASPTTLRPDVAPRHPVHPSPSERQLGAARCASVNPRLVWRYAPRHGIARTVLVNRPWIVHRD